MSTTAEQPWHAAFPTPSSDPPRITSEELHQLIGAQPDLSKRDFLVVDVRRTDFENGFITGAVNLPAHSFYPTVASLIPLLSRYSTVYFHCNSSSPGGRGGRSAGWYQDALDQAGIKTSKAVILTGGIKRWLELYGEDAAVTTKL